MRLSEDTSVYVRVGSLNACEPSGVGQEPEQLRREKRERRSLWTFAPVQVTTDLSLATEFAKRFCPKGKTLFTLRKPTGRQDRVFSSDRDPAFRGLVMVLDRRRYGWRG